MKKLVVLVLCTLSLGAFFLSPLVATPVNSAANPDSPSDVNISFNVTPVSHGAWYGQTSGGVSGELTIEAPGSLPRPFRSAWAGATEWTVVAGPNTFSAILSGKVNTLNGTALMRGTIFNGQYLGARVEVRGRISEVNPARFVGAIRVIQP